jgi:hypothetical protein
MVLTHISALGGFLHKIPGKGEIKTQGVSVAVSIHI